MQSVRGIPAQMLGVDYLVGVSCSTDILRYYISLVETLDSTRGSNYVMRGIDSIHIIEEVLEILNVLDYFWDKYDIVDFILKILDVISKRVDINPVIHEGIYASSICVYPV
jgi:hypothetical protein